MLTCCLTFSCSNYLEKQSDTKRLLFVSPEELHLNRKSLNGKKLMVEGCIVKIKGAVSIPTEYFIFYNQEIYEIIDREKFIGCGGPGTQDISYVLDIKNGSLKKMLSKFPDRTHLWVKLQGTLNSNPILIQHESVSLNYCGVLHDIDIKSIQEEKCN